MKFKTVRHQNCAWRISVKVHLKDWRTSVSSFVRLCLLCLSGACILWGTNRDAS